MNSNVMNIYIKKEPFDSGLLSRISVFPLFQSQIHFPLLFLKILSFLQRGFELGSSRNKRGVANFLKVLSWPCYNCSLKFP
jgi:hypothetical protein